MNRPVLLLALAAACLGPAAARAAPRAATRAPVIAVLCYHDLSGAPGAPAYTVPPESLRVQIRRARRAGWSILPLSRVLAAAARPSRLPPRVLVLTFDDGYRSFAEAALPILRAEKAPATLSVITSFVDRPPPDLPPLLDWDALRRLDRDGLVEIASHSHDLHRYVPSNPYGDTAPAASTRRYLPDEQRYENRDEYRERIAADLRESQRRLRHELGHDVRVLAWPYGEHTEMAREVAAAAGFAATLGLEGGAAAPESLAAGYLPRVMVYRDTPVAAADSAWLSPPPRPVRAVRVDLDDLYDPDPAQVDARVGRVVARLAALGATHVFLQGLADPVGDGFLARAWFMNHQLPVLADLWSMVAGRLGRAGVQVWIRVPTANLSWAWAEHPEWRVPCPLDPAGERRRPQYFRLAPDLAEARRAAADFYTDLAVYLPVRGVLFDDDAYLVADEPLAGGSLEPAAKRDALRGLLDEIKSAVRAWRPQCRFGRVLYPAALAREGTVPEFAQDLAECVREDELVVVRAVPPATASPAADSVWADGLARRAAARGAATAPVLLEVQACAPGSERCLAGPRLAALLRVARRAGAEALGVSRLLPAAGDFPDGLLRPAPPLP